MMKTRKMQSAILYVLMLAVVFCGFAGVGAMNASAAELDTNAEAWWGSSAENLTASGTLADAFAAATADSSIAYVQLQNDVTSSVSYQLSGTFTVDLNGHSITSTYSGYALFVLNGGSSVTFRDSNPGDNLVSITGSTDIFGCNTGAHIAIESGKYQTEDGNVLGGIFPDNYYTATITGGTLISTYEESYTVNLAKNAVVTVSGDAVIQSSGYSPFYVNADALLVIRGGTFSYESSPGGTVYLPGSPGSVDLSLWTLPADFRVFSNANGDNVFDRVFMPAGYAIALNDTAVTTLESGKQYAAKEQETYAITFAAGDGGSGSMPVRNVWGASATVTLPACGFTPPAQMRFKAWSVGGAEKAAGETVTVSEATTVTALWEIEPVFAVSFDGNGGTGTMEPVSGLTDPLYTLPTCGFTAPDGKQFAYWTVGDDTENHYAPGDPITLSAESTTIKANWAGQTYTVTLKAGDGTGDDVAGANVVQGASLTLPTCPNSFTAPAGKKFVGWSVQVGSGDANDMNAGDVLQNVTDNVTLTAIWTDRYILTQAPTVVTDLTYNGEEQTLITAGTVSDGTLQYRVNGGAWATALPAATNAGEYTIDYRIFFSESETYLVDTVEVTVAKLAITPTLEGVPGEYYDPQVSEEAPTNIDHLLSLTANGETLVPSADYSVEYLNNKALGVATVTVTATENGNYSFAPIQKQFTIVNHQHEWTYSVDPEHANVAHATCTNGDGNCSVVGSVTLTLTAPQNAIYDGLEKTAMLIADNGMYNISLHAIAYKTDEGSWLEVPIETGTYVAYIGFDAEKTIEIRYNIAPMDIVLEWSNTELTYHGAPQGPTASVVTALPANGDSATVTVEGEWTDAGSYTATATVESANYRITNPTQAVTIAPKALTLVWSDDVFIYNGEEQLPTAEFAEQPYEHVELTVLFDGNGYPVVAYDNYRAIASIDNSNYTLTNPTRDFRIEKQTVEIPFIPSVVYCGELQTADVEISDIYTVEKNEGGTDAGEYDVVLKLNNSTSYRWETTDEETVTLKFVIEKDILEYSFELEYTGEAQLPEITDDAVFTLVTQEGFTDVGTYELVLKMKPEYAANYGWENPDPDDESLTTASLTITKRINEWIVFPEMEDWCFGDAPSIPVYEAMYDNESVTVRYMPADGSEEDLTTTVPTAIGQYVAIFTIPEGDTYTQMEHQITFQILPPRVIIGFWAIPALHYVDTNGMVSTTRPEGGYAYLREDGTLVLNNFELDASVFGELLASEDPAVLEQLEAYSHLRVDDYLSQDIPYVVIALNGDATVLLLGNNELTVGNGFPTAIQSGAGPLTIRGGSLYTDGVIFAKGGDLTVESSLIRATMVNSGGTVTLTSSILAFTNQPSGLGGESLVMTDSTVAGSGATMVRVFRNATLENSAIYATHFEIMANDGTPGELTVRNSRIELENSSGLMSYQLTAENSVFKINADEIDEIDAIQAYRVAMTNCELMLTGADCGISAVYLDMTECKVVSDCDQFFSAEMGDVVLNRCDVTVSGTGEHPLIAAGSLTVNGGKLTLTGNGPSVILVYSFDVTDAEITLTYADQGIEAEYASMRNATLTIMQNQESTLYGIAIDVLEVDFTNCTVTVTGGMTGIRSELLVCENTTMEITLQVPESAMDMTNPQQSADAIQEESGDGSSGGEISDALPGGIGSSEPYYMGIYTTILALDDSETVLKISFPEEAYGDAVFYAEIYFDGNFEYEISAPEGATFEATSGSYYHPVLRDGETVTYPNAVTVSCVEIVTEPDTEPLEDMVAVGGVEMSDGDYLDNNGNISSQKPTGGYAYLKDGVLTLHDFTYYGSGYYFGAIYEDGGSSINAPYAGIYSVNGLTVRVEGKNLIDVSTFVTDVDTNGIFIWGVGDLLIEGDGTLEIRATEQIIDVLGNLTVKGVTLKLNSASTKTGIKVDTNLTITDCRIELASNGIGIDCNGAVLMENCHLKLTSVQDAISAEDNIILVDCTGEITSTKNDGIYVDDDLSDYGDIVLIDCTLTVTAYDDAIDSERELTLIGCELVLVSDDNGIEFDDAANITDSVLDITAYGCGISGDKNAQLTNCRVTIRAEDDGIRLSAGDLQLVGGTVNIYAENDGVILYGVGGDVTVADCTLSVITNYGGIRNMETGNVDIRNSAVAISASGDEGICVSYGKITVSDSKLNVSSYEECLQGDEVILINCSGSLFSNYNNVINAYRTHLSDCRMRMKNQISEPLINTTILQIDGKDTHIQAYHDDGYLVATGGDSLILIDEALGFRTGEDMEPAYFDILGFVYDMAENRVSEFEISAPEEDAEEVEPVTNTVLVIGDKELEIGQYLDNEGNVTDIMPTGGFAYFTGSELLLKSFTYEGGGTTLVNLNGETVTAGIYCDKDLIIRLIGDNTLTLTSYDTTGISIGDGDLTVTGDGSLTLTATGEGISLNGDLTVEDVTLTVTADTAAIWAFNVTFTDATVALVGTDAENVTGIYAMGTLTVTDCDVTVEAVGGIHADASVTLTDSTVSLTVKGTSAYGIYSLCGNLAIVNSSLNIISDGEDARGIELFGILSMEGAYTNCSVSVSGTQPAILASGIEIAEELVVLTPEGGTVGTINDGGYSILNADQAAASVVVIGVPPRSADEALVTVGGIDLADGEYLDNEGNITTEQPKGGYAYLKDGVLTLNNFTYLTKKYDSREGIRAGIDLTLILIGENLLSTYDQYGIFVEGDLSMTGNGSLNVTTNGTGIYSSGVLTVNCGGVTVTAGESALAAQDAIILGELVELSVPAGARIQRFNGYYVVMNQTGNVATDLQITWIAHTCVDENEADHLCDICGKEYTTCTDNDHDHACDICNDEVGYHADTNGDHVCEYGCGVAIGTCEDTDKDHTCDYGCGKSYGEHADANKDHTCDYGCSVKIGDHADVDHDHVCDHGCATAIGTCEDSDKDHTCDYGCGKSYGEHADANKDHTCDYGCSVKIGDHTDVDHDHVCDHGCTTAIGTCQDSDKDHTCDYGCGKSYGEHADANKDHTCDYGCSIKIGDHADVDHDHICDHGCTVKIGTCTDTDRDHACDYGCDNAIGEHVAESGSHICAYCNESASDCADANSDHECDVCGAELTHSHSTEWNKNDFAHWHECACGDVADIAAHIPGAPATETAAQTCTVCGYILAPATGHTSHTPKDTWDSDETHHWHACTECNTQQLNKAAHEYDNACDTTCNICGKTRTITHSYAVAWSKNAEKHWHECSICGDKKDEAAHTLGAPATETTAQICTVCEYIITPATGHTSHTPKDTWDSDATHHWHECTGCADRQLDKEEHSYDNDCDTDCNLCGKIRSVAHDYATQWSGDGTKHWHACGVCGEKADEAPHSYGDWTVIQQPTAEKDGRREKVCACGMKMTEIIPALTPDDGGENDGLPVGAVVGIAIGSAVVAGAGGFAIWWFVISRRTLAQLGAGCKAVASKAGSACKTAFEKVKSLFTKK